MQRHLEKVDAIEVLHCTSGVNSTVKCFLNQHYFLTVIFVIFPIFSQTKKVSLGLVTNPWINANYLFLHHVCLVWM